MSEEYKKGYRDGFEEGFKVASKLFPAQTYPVSAAAPGCPVCGMSWKNGAVGYVCYNPKCPTRVTCDVDGKSLWGTSSG